MAGFSPSPFVIAGRSVTLRFATAADAAFLRQVYASTRESELACVPWTNEQKQQFIAHQFTAQDQAYRTNYPGADFFVIEVEGAPAGRLYVFAMHGELRIMDIALLPPFRAQGLGTALLCALQTFAGARGEKLSIHVEAFNPARRLYERLGFAVVGKHDEVYLLLEWTKTTRTP